MLSITGSLPPDIFDVDCVMLGVYNGTRLLDCVDISNPTQNKLNVEIKNMQEADKVKLFRWGGLLNIMPLYNTVDITVN